MSLPHLAVAEPCDGEQLPALLSGLENVRCDTAAAAEGQADKEWARERVWSEGRGLPANRLLSAGRGLGETHVMPRARSCLPPPAARSLPRVARCPSGFACVSRLRRETCRVGGCLVLPESARDWCVPPARARREHPTGAPGAAWGTRRLRLGSRVGAGSQLRCCSDPAQPQGQAACQGVPVTTGRARAQHHPTGSHPGRGFAASCLFGCCRTGVGLQRAPSCLPVNLWGQV